MKENSRTGFSAEAWEGIEGLVGRILDHPFNRELAAGTLSTERFRRYLLQDSIYLDAFARALALAAARSDDAGERVFFLRAAAESVEVEQDLHAVYFRRFGISEEAVRSAEPSPACLCYTGYLSTLAYQEAYPVLVAALLPCFWIYWEVGRTIQKHAAAENPYQAWIDLYAGEEYGSVVEEVLRITDDLASRSDAGTRQGMLRAFRRASQLEWLFWDSVYRMEDWPTL